jgi:ubiquinone/menaquinone biosynthesis C-methylase UbiE
VFTKTARYYDEIYSFKDYVQESERIHEAIENHLKTDGRDLLDVACGTGKHIELLSQWFRPEGLDVDEAILNTARERNPQVRFRVGSMETFDAGRTYDVVTCLFSSIAYMTTLGQMQKAVGNMARHVKPGGVLVLEPFLYPESYTPGFLHFLHVDEPDLKVARMSCSEQEGSVAVLNFHYLIGTPEGVTHETERHELGLYTQTEYQEALEACRLTVDYDPVGPMGRGLFVGVKA